MNRLIFLEIGFFFMFFLFIFYLSLHLMRKHSKSIGNLTPEIQIQFASRLVSSVHSFIVFFISLLVLLIDENISQKIM